LPVVTDVPFKRSKAAALAIQASRIATIMPVKGSRSDRPGLDQNPDSAFDMSLVPGAALLAALRCNRWHGRLRKATMLKFFVDAGYVANQAATPT